MEGALALFDMESRKYRVRCKVSPTFLLSFLGSQQRKNCNRNFKENIHRTFWSDLMPRMV